MKNIIFPALMLGFIVASCEKEQDTFTDFSHGCEAVDLGLSVKWASYNVGASRPEEYGSYFAWGETEEKENYSWDKAGDYMWGVYDEDSYTCGMTRYTGSVGDRLEVLLPSDDPATKNWGTKWRTPTIDEVRELYDPVICEWSEWDPVRKGYTVRSRKTGNSIFFPAAGVRSGSDLKYAGESGKYWTASKVERIPQYSYFLSFVEESFVPYAYRCNGLPVRAVSNESSRRIDDDRRNQVIVTGDCLEVSELSATISGWSNKKKSDGSSVVYGIECSYSDFTTDCLEGRTTYINADNQFGCKITGLSPGIRYNYRAFVQVDGKRWNGEVKSFQTLSRPVPDGAVELGLSVCWASCNLGASRPEDFGGYYQWAGTENVADAENLGYESCPYYIGPDKETGWSKYFSENSVLAPEDDAAALLLKGKWHIPSKDEWMELCNPNSCSFLETDINGVRGLKIQSKKPGYTDNWIFLPFCGKRPFSPLEMNRGYYWSSSITPLLYKSRAYEIGSSPIMREEIRYKGLSIRPVSE